MGEYALERTACAGVHWLLAKAMGEHVLGHFA